MLVLNWFVVENLLGSSNFYFMVVISKKKKKVLYIYIYIYIFVPGTLNLLKSMWCCHWYKIFILCVWITEKMMFMYNRTNRIRPCGPMRLELVSYKYMIVIQYEISMKNKPIVCALVHLSLSLSLLISLFLYGEWLPRIKSISLQSSSIPL